MKELDVKIIPDEIVDGYIDTYHAFTDMFEELLDHSMTQPTLNTNPSVKRIHFPRWMISIARRVYKVIRWTTRKLHMNNILYRTRIYQSLNEKGYLRKLGL